jgi:hypothetical protein
MGYWIKKFARIVGIVCFFIVFFTTLDYSRPFELDVLLWSLGEGLAAAAMFWFVGFIIGDMMFKGIVEDVRTEDVDELEGGLMQRVRETRQQAIPRSDSVPEPKALAAKTKEKLGVKA